MLIVLKNTYDETGSTNFIIHLFYYEGFMLESIITISITGFLAGFIFAMPIAGPISILIVSNSLKGKSHYSNMINIGAAFADLIYIFIAVYGLTRLYSFYKPAIPYLFMAGSVFFIILGIKVFRTHIDIDIGHFEGKNQITERILNKEKGGLYTGFMVNLLNPTLFISSLTSSFFVISFVASLGFNTGGLDLKIQNNVKEISTLNGSKIENVQPAPFDSFRKLDITRKKENEKVDYPSYFHMLISFAYAFFIALGGIIWFYLLAYILARYRYKMNVIILRGLIRGFGIILCILGLYFGYLGASEFL